MKGPPWSETPADASPPCSHSPVLQTGLCAALRSESRAWHFQAQYVVAGGLFRGIVGVTVWCPLTSARCLSSDWAPGPLDPGACLAPGAGQRCCVALWPLLCLS